MTRDLTPVHPDLQQAAATFPRLTFNRWTLRPIRWLMRLQPTPKRPSDVSIEQILIPTPDRNHQIRLRLYKPKARTSPVPALLWMHGGGLIIGSPEMNDAHLSRFVHDLGIVAMSVDYRLAPEHPFPTPLEDCYTALTWVQAHAESLGIDAARIAIGGESAGGGLAAALAQVVHDRGEVRVAFQLLIYPMLDDASAVRAHVPHPDLLVWNQASNRFGWESYLGQPCGSATVPPYAVPARRTDLTGLPAAWIGVGTLDLFHDEDVAYAQRLQTHGVPCDLVIVPGAFHGFDTFDKMLGVVQDFQISQIEALRRALLEN